jgi:N-hydroxyarylamine O-acetyltransferase
MDNLRKLVHLRADDPGPLPGDTPEDFFAGWLAHGTGGTCWAVHGALTALLEACGFEARRGIGTMLVAPDLPPNHGLTSVRLDDETLLVDGCILHGEPLLLMRRETAVEHLLGAHGPQRAMGRRWRSPFAPDG